MIYTIYHIKGIKVGVTTDLTKRRHVLGKTDFRYDEDIEVLEVIRRGQDNRTSWRIVGDREIYWRKHFGYRSDNNHYSMSRQKLFLANAAVSSEAKARGGKNTATRYFTSKRQAKYAPLGPAKQFAGGTHINQLGKSGFQTRTTCPVCKQVGRLAAMKRWHFDNCKHRSVE